MVTSRPTNVRAERDWRAVRATEPTGASHLFFMVAATSAACVGHTRSIKSSVCRRGSRDLHARVRGRNGPYRGLRDRLLKKIVDNVPEVLINGSMDQRMPNNLNISFTFIEGESLLMALEMWQFRAVRPVPASLEPSYVLRAIGVEDENAHSSIRFGIGRFNTEEEIDYVADLVIESVEKLRKMSPLWEMHQKASI